MQVSITVNGVATEQDVEPRLLLVHFLRDTLGLTGTNVGCDTSSCGACTVLLDGKSVKSCTVLAVQADGREVTTIEGLASDGALHPMQEAFREHHGLQCGFCTPGMVLAAVSLANEGRADRRGIGARRPRRQPVPLHRLPQHRAGRAGGSEVVSPVVGTPLRRKEDARLLTGEARYVDDLAVPGIRFLGMVRSPHAHARVTSIDTSAALATPGVEAVLTGADLADAWAAPMPCAWPVTPGHAEPAAPPDRDGHRLLRRRHRGGRRRHVPLRGPRRRRRRRRRVRPVARRSSTSRTRRRTGCWSTTRSGPTGPTRGRSCPTPTPSRPPSPPPRTPSASGTCSSA